MNAIVVIWLLIIPQEGGYNLRNRVDSVEFTSQQQCLQAAEKLKETSWAFKHAFCIRKG